jgi:PhnB protein
MSMHIHVNDVDQLFAQAVAAGGTVLRPLQNQFYGERSGTVRDPFGHHWLLGGQLEEVSPQEMQRRYTALFEKV